MYHRQNIQYQSCKWKMRLCKNIMSHCKREHLFYGTVSVYACAFFYVVIYVMLWYVGSIQLPFCSVSIFCWCCCCFVCVRVRKRMQYELNMDLCRANTCTIRCCQNSCLFLFNRSASYAQTQTHIHTRTISEKHSNREREREKEPIN